MKSDNFGLRGPRPECESFMNFWRSHFALSERKGVHSEFNSRMNQIGSVQLFTHRRSNKKKIFKSENEDENLHRNKLTVSFVLCSVYFKM